MRGEPARTRRSTRHPASDQDRLGQVAKAIALLAPLFYLLGTHFRAGYLEGLGLRNALDPLPPDQTLLLGFHCIVTWMSMLTSYLSSSVIVGWSLMAVVLTIGQAVVRVVLLRYRHYAARVKDRVQAHTQASAPTSGTLLGLLLIAAPMMAFIVTIYLVLPLILAEAAGQWQAEKMIKRGMSQYPVALIRNAGESGPPEEGRLVDGDDSHVIVRSAGRFLVIPKSSLLAVEGIKL